MLLVAYLNMNIIESVVRYVSYHTALYIWVFNKVGVCVHHIIGNVD